MRDVEKNLIRMMMGPKNLYLENVKTKFHNGEDLEYPQGGTPWGPLVFEVGYHPRKKIHIIRFVFQDRVMYICTLFRGAKSCKIRKKGCFFFFFWSFLQI